MKGFVCVIKRGILTGKESAGWSLKLHMLRAVRKKFIAKVVITRKYIKDNTKRIMQAEGSGRRPEESQIILFVCNFYLPKVSKRTFFVSSSMFSVTIIIISVVSPKSFFIFVNKCSKGKGEIQAEFFRQTKPAFFKR